MKRIRVLHVITRMVRGGAQQVVLHLAERLDRGRFETEVVCGEEDPALVPELERRAPVRRVPSLVREISPRRDLRALAALRRLARGFDVVHGHTYKAGVLASVAGRMAGAPAVVFTPHGHIFAAGARIPGVPTGGRLRLLRTLTRWAQSCAHVITALSEEDLEEQLSHRLAPRGKYVVIRNGIDVERFADGARRGSRGMVIGSVGRLTTEKGHRYLIPMLRRLPEARLMIVGEGPERGAILAEAERLRVGDRLDLTGERDSAEVLCEFDVYVQPSLYESQGLAILEAMAAGVPVVATRVGGVPGVVQDGRTGLLVPPGDDEAMAAAVLRLAGDEGFARSLVEAARDLVRREFSVDRMVRDYERLYLRLLQR